MVKSVYEQLHQNPGALQGTLQHARYLQHLNVVLTEHLDPTLAQHCQLANVRAETAVVQADSPVWAAKLRYQIPTILELLNTCVFIAEAHPHQDSLTSNFECGQPINPTPDSSLRSLPFAALGRTSAQRGRHYHGSSIEAGAFASVETLAPSGTEKL